MILKYGGDSNTTHKIHFNVTITIDGMELKYEKYFSHLHR